MRADLYVTPNNVYRSTWTQKISHRCPCSAVGQWQLAVQRNYKFVILHSKAFPSQTILARALLHSPMFSDPPGLAGLGPAYPECNDHCTQPVSDDRRQKVRGVPSRPRLHVLVYSLEAVLNLGNKLRQMTCRTLVRSPVGANNRNVFEKY
jgi:hypothetical protein